MKFDLINSSINTLEDFEKNAAKAGISPDPYTDPLCGDSCICAFVHTSETNFKTRTFA